MADNLLNPADIGTGGLKGIRANQTGDTQLPSGPTLQNTQNILNQNSSGSGYVGQYLPDDVSRYDEAIRTQRDLENIENVRAENQSNFLKASNAIATGVLGGLATAAQDLSYLLDFQTHLEKLGAIEDTGRAYEENEVSQWAKDFKEGLYEAIPIYEDPNTTGISDSFLRWSTLRAGLDSIVGFGIGGWGAGALTKGAQVLLRTGAKRIKLNAYKNILTRGLTGSGVEGSIVNAA